MSNIFPFYDIIIDNKKNYTKKLNFTMNFEDNTNCNFSVQIQIR